MGNAPRSARLDLVAAALVTTSAVGACDPHLADGFSVYNQTNVTLHFGITGDAGVSMLPGSASPYSTALVVPMTYDWPGGCVTETLIAYDPSGREVARHSPPLCDRDRWVIGGPSPPPSS